MTLALIWIQTSYPGSRTCALSHPEPCHWQWARHIHQSTDRATDTHLWADTLPQPLCTQGHFHGRSQGLPMPPHTHTGLTCWPHPFLSGPLVTPSTLPSPPRPPPLSPSVLFPSACPPTCWPPAQLRAGEGVGWLFCLPRQLGCGHLLTQDENAEICPF